MDIKKWGPWNWFKKEEGDTGNTVPVKRETTQDHGGAFSNSLVRFHREIDRLFDQAFRGFGLTPFDVGRLQMPRLTDGMLKPNLDLGATDKKYTIALEIPGVDEKDLKLEIANDTLTIRGEKKHEKEEKQKGYYRMERSYGSFQRSLSLPEDADQDGIKAKFKKGVLNITMPRKKLPGPEVRRIQVQSV